MDESRTGGQLAAAALAHHGVGVAYCVPGESYLEILDALVDYPAIQVVQCRHENGAAYMAEAHAKLTGRVGVAMVTRGPGACNASIGIHTAYQDSTPMVVLVGQVARPHLGKEAFQEVDYKAMFGPLAKAVDEVGCAADIQRAIAWAFHTAASGRPGPVVLALPEDILRETAIVDDADLQSVAEIVPSTGDVERLHHILHDAERPLVMVGGGGWRGVARVGLAAFIENNGLPVCTSFRRMDLFDNAHPLYVGEVGIGPNPALIAGVREADVLLVVGARLGEMTSQGYSLLEGAREDQTLIHVHADKAELGKVYEPAVGVCATPTGFAHALQGVDIGESARWHEWAANLRTAYSAWSKPGDYDEDIDLGQVMTFLDGEIPDDAVLTVDAGNFSGWPQRFLRFGSGRRLLGPTSGAMGYSVPAGVAAAVAAPDRKVISFVGDGGFGMTGQELATAKLAGVQPIILVFNNGIYGTIRMHQEGRHPDRVMATDLANPNFAELAQAYGCFGETVRTTADFAPAWRRAIESGLPALIELVTDPNRISPRTTLDAIRKQALSR